MQKPTMQKPSKPNTSMQKPSLPHPPPRAPYSNLNDDMIKDWERHPTPDDRIYYHSPSTGIKVWDPWREGQVAAMDPNRPDSDMLILRYHTWQGETNYIEVEGTDAATLRLIHDYVLAVSPDFPPGKVGNLRVDVMMVNEKGEQNPNEINMAVLVKFVETVCGYKRKDSGGGRIFEFAK